MLDPTVHRSSITEAVKNDITSIKDSIVNTQYREPDHSNTVLPNPGFEGFIFYPESFEVT